HAVRLGPDRWRCDRRRTLRLGGPCAQRRFAADAGRFQRERRRGGLGLLARGTLQQAGNDPVGPDRSQPSGARFDPRLRRTRGGPAVARLFDLAPLHAADRPGFDPEAPPRLDDCAPAKAGAQTLSSFLDWTPAFAGVRLRLTSLLWLSWLP